MSDSDLPRVASPPASEGASGSLDLSQWPPIYLEATHFDTEHLHEFEEDLDDAHAILTYAIHEAEVILSRAVKKARIKFDLRAKGVYTEEIESRQSTTPSSSSGRKRKREGESDATHPISDLTAFGEGSTDVEGNIVDRTGPNHETDQLICDSKQRSGEDRRSDRMVRVLRTEWFADSKKLGKPQPLEKYITYQGRVVESPAGEKQPEAGGHKVLGHASGKDTATPKKSAIARPIPIGATCGSEILRRATADASAVPSKVDRFGSRKYHNPHVNTASWEAGRGTQPQHASLLQQTTTEYEDASSSEIPEAPDWVKQRLKYACQRTTPKSNPNDTFIKLLGKIKTARLLTNDEIGVRAYATSIAALAAYNHVISHPQEILRLPGCDAKIANLWIEWKNTGKIKAVEEAEADEDLKILRSFHNIWGCGVATAREFYYDKGWRDLDDVVEYGWSGLTQVQQIGVKYYEEFEDPIPRAEVESICEVIHRHAVKVRDDGIQSLIVGGYRRGKEACGDVDIVISHPDEAATHNIITEIVASLEEEGWITHTLTLSLHNSKRSQQTLPFRADGGGHGFDTLDKALVVWQNPMWGRKEQDLGANPQAKNPNIHRRVDIIISPWRTVGCAVLGWSGGTTFERDLRRYARAVQGWKFDSSGVRDRGNGEVVDVEGYIQYGEKVGVEGRATSMEEAERRVFEGFGLTYRPATERCTG